MRYKKIGFIALLTGLFFLCLRPELLPAGQEEGKWSNVHNLFTRDGKSKKRNERIKATRDLVDAIYPAVQPKACELLLTQLKEELNRNQGGKKEENVEFQILDACVSGFKKVTDDKVIQILIKKVTDNTLNWRFRFHMIQGLGGITHDEVKKTLVELLSNSDSRIQIAAIDALAALKSKETEVMEPVSKLLAQAPQWEIKIAAIDFFRVLESSDSVPLLIEALKDKSITGRVKGDLINLLSKLTGENLGYSVQGWVDWREREKKEESAGADSPDELKNMTITKYYGIQAYSTRVVFVLDLSNSMNWDAHDKRESEEQKEESLRPEQLFVDEKGNPAPPALIAWLQKIKDEVNKIDKKKIINRISMAKRELINTLYNLHPSVNFTMVFFGDRVDIWEKTLVPATAENKKKAINHVYKIGSLGWTWMWDGIETAYRFTDQKGKVALMPQEADYVGALGGADTMFIVSDGPPDSGKLLAKLTGTSQGVFGNTEHVAFLKDAILDEIKKLHPIRRIKINTIAVGRPDRVQDVKGCYDPCPDFLRSISELTGGKSVNKTTD